MRLVGERTETGGQAARPPGVVLQGVLERITYANEETGYTSPGWPPSGRGGSC